jgi:hypothetical protein
VGAFGERGEDAAVLRVDVDLGGEGVAEEGNVLAGAFDDGNARLVT